jgi:hypothetical protein
VVDLGRALGAKPSRTPQEEEIVAMMLGTFSDARKMGRDEGRTEGETAGRAGALLTVLRARRVTVPDAARERILAEKDPVQLDRWIERAVLAGSVADVFAESSRAA